MLEITCTVLTLETIQSNKLSFLRSEQNRRFLSWKAACSFITCKNRSNNKKIVRAKYQMKCDLVSSLIIQKHRDSHSIFSSEKPLHSKIVLSFHCFKEFQNPANIIWSPFFTLNSIFNEVIMLTSLESQNGQISRRKNT